MNANESFTEIANRLLFKYDNDPSFGVREVGAELDRLFAERGRPEQGGATEEQIEAALDAVLLHRWSMASGYCACNDHFISEQAFARHAVEAALSASASAHPADERHDAEEREAESEDHAATEGRKVPHTGPGHGAGDAGFCEGCAAEREDHAATVTSDREKLIAEARVILGRTMVYDEVANMAERLADALATAVEVDEAKLAEVLDAHSRYVMVAPGVNECGCGVPVGPVKAWNEHKAGAVAEWLRGVGR